MYFSDKCTSLLNNPDLKTSATLPVNRGTSVEVDCIPGYSLTGSRVITCIKDKIWEYSETPECTLGGYLHFSDNMVLKNSNYVCRFKLGQEQHNLSGLKIISVEGDQS